MGALFEGLYIPSLKGPVLPPSYIKGSLLAQACAYPPHAQEHSGMIHALGYRGLQRAICS